MDSEIEETLEYQKKSDSVKETPGDESKGKKSERKSKKKSRSSKYSNASEQKTPKDTEKLTDHEDLQTSKERHLRSMELERQSTASKRKHQLKSVIAPDVQESVLSAGSASSVDMDVVTLEVSETAQKIVHCLVGKDLFVDKTWCMVKKKDLLEDIAIEDANSPFFQLTHKILDYKPDEFLIGYEPFASEPNQFMLCVTEAGRDDVLNKLEEMKSMYLRRIQQSKAVEPKKWESLGSEEFVNQFQIKNTRKKISLEWIGDISKRCYTEPKFEDCDPDDMKNGYTCLVPSDKEKFDLVFRKTQETGVQAVASKAEAEVQTDPEIPTNASTQYAPETEISIPDTTITQAAIKSQDLDAFFKKYQDYLLECLEYNEVYDLYNDDYPALYVAGEETQVQQLGTYHQYQSFTDVAAIEGKLVVSSSWHPNYTGIVAIAYANEISCLMKELEFDSDQTDYEEEKTDDEGEKGEEPELGAGARDWLEDEQKERESTSENTELFDRAVRRLKDIESAKIVWDAKIQEETDETRKPTDETLESNLFANLLQYKEYKEPKPEPELEEEEEKLEESATSQVSSSQREGKEEVEEESEDKEKEGETLEPLGTEERVSPKSSKLTYREQLEADIEESQEVTLESSTIIGQPYDQESIAASTRTPHGIGALPTLESHDPSLSLQVSRDSKSTIGSLTSAHKLTHHRRKHKKKLAPSRQHSQAAVESLTSFSSGISSSLDSRIMESSKERETGLESEFFDEVTDEEEIKEKQDELPLLEVNNPVLIWSFVDDLTPKLRLDSPYEVRVVSFSKHDGNLIAGGTASGQVVLWDITGRIEELEKPESLTQNQQMFRKRMEDLMSWRRDIRSKRRVRFTAISNHKESHLEKITDLAWISPNKVVTDKLEVLRNPSSDPALQLLTCCISGSVRLWDLRTQPSKGEYRKVPQIFKTKDRFGRPASLDMGLSPYHKLHRLWKPIRKITIMYKNIPVLLTGFSIHHFPEKHVRVTPKLQGVKELMEDRIEYKTVYSEEGDIPNTMYICNLFGQAGTIVWDPLAHEDPEKPKIDFINVYKYWDSYHDRPITRLSKHPFIPTVCLTVGGHVFAVWHINNLEEPILVKRYYGVYVTDGIWSSLRPSLMRIARSDGVVEIWDLIIQSHAPATTIVVSGRVITNISPPLLPEVRGLLGVADYNSAFCLFYIPQQFRVWTENELVRLTKFINCEPERRKKMREWSKWWRENNVNIVREEKKQAEVKKKLDEEVRLEKEKQEEARKKYNEEVYKWYMRRRGKSFLWSEEADDKWREKQEEHMHEMVMAKKKIDRSEMEILMRPIVREEKNEALKHAKAQERLNLADTIFRQTVELIFPKGYKTVEVHSQEEVNLSDQCIKLVEYYFTNFEKLADEQVTDFIERNPWQFEFEWYELLEKYNALRMLFNDQRRKRSKTLRWLRKKLREELLKEGRKVHIKKSHMARYPKRKIKRRQQHLDKLQHTYGDDYNIYWDKHQPCRRFADRKFRYAVEEVESAFLGELSEPDVEDEEIAQIIDEGKVMSSLEMITEIGVEHISEETFAADLDTALLTLESRSSLGVKKIPSLFDKTSRKTSHELSDRSREIKMSLGKELSLEHEEGEPSDHLAVPGIQSPDNDSVMSLEIEITDDTSPMVDNQLQELDYIQQRVGTNTNTQEVKRAQATHKRDVSHGVKITFEEPISDDFVLEGEGSSELEAEEEGAEGEDQKGLSKTEGPEGEEREEGEEGDEKEKGNGSEEEPVEESVDPDVEIAKDTNEFQ